MSDKYTIYTLVDPITNEVRYLGRTKRKLSARLNAHKTDSSSYDKYMWFQSLVAQSKTPSIIKIDEVDGLEQANIKEQEYIKHYLSIGCNLLNMTHCRKYGTYKGYKDYPIVNK